MGAWPEFTRLNTLDRPIWLGPWRLMMNDGWFIRERMIRDTYEMVCVPALAAVNDDLRRPLVAEPRSPR